MKQEEREGKEEVREVRGRLRERAQHDRQAWLREKDLEQMKPVLRRVKGSGGSKRW